MSDYINISDIQNADFSDDTEPRDDKLIELLKLAYTKKIVCRNAGLQSLCFLAGIINQSNIQYLYD